MTIPRDLGGPGLGFLEVAPVIEEMARVCGVTGRIAVEANMGAVSAIMAYGREAQKRLAAAPVLAGDNPAICTPEPGARRAATAMPPRAHHRRARQRLPGGTHRTPGRGR